MNLWNRLHRWMTGTEKVITARGLDRANWRPARSPAYERMEQEDWQGALALCLEEAERLPEASPVLELNILICKYHLGHNGGLAKRAISLAKMHRSVGTICCWGLAMLSAHRFGDLELATRVACVIAQELTKPWDLPTVPRWVHPFRNDVVVQEIRSTHVVLRVVEDLRAQHTISSEQAQLLDVLAQRYREREELDRAAGSSGA